MKRCTLCGIEQPTEQFGKHPRGKDGLQSRCRTCRVAAKRVWAASHQDHVRTYDKNYRAEHREEERAGKNRRYREEERLRLAAQERVRAWRAADPERTTQARHEFYLRHRTEIRIKTAMHYRLNASRIMARVRAYADAHPEAIRSAKRRYLEMNREQFRVYWHRRRARFRAAEGHFSASDVALLLEAQHGLCAYCGVAFGSTYHVEHKVPLVRGGSNWPTNLALSCPRCNLRKGRLTAEEFVERLGLRHPG